jgi:hypothetical protein
MADAGRTGKSYSLSLALVAVLAWGSGPTEPPAMLGPAVARETSLAPDGEPSPPATIAPAATIDIVTARVRQVILGDLLRTQPSPPPRALVLR